MKNDTSFMNTEIHKTKYQQRQRSREPNYLRKNHSPPSTDTYRAETVEK